APRTENPRSWEAGSSLIAVPSAFSAVMDGARTEPSSSWSVLDPLTRPNSSEDSGSTATARSETAGLGGGPAGSAAGTGSSAPPGSTSGPSHQRVLAPGSDCAVACSTFRGEDGAVVATAPTEIASGASAASASRDRRPLRRSGRSGCRSRGPSGTVRSAIHLLHRTGADPPRDRDQSGQRDPGVQQHLPEQPQRLVAVHVDLTRRAGRQLEPLGPAVHLDGCELVAVEGRAPPGVEALGEDHGARGVVGGHRALGVDGGAVQRDRRISTADDRSRCRVDDAPHPAAGPLGDLLQL